MSALYTAEATATGGREGRVRSSDGALNLELSDALRQEGLAREVVHAVQNARKAAGLSVEDRIALTLGGSRELLDAVRAHEPYVAGETLATSISYDGAGGGGSIVHIEGLELSIEVARA